MESILTGNPVEGGPQPGAESDTENFTLLLQELREKINELNDEYLITLATTQNINRVNYIEISKINDLVDFINIMTYDYNGPLNNNLPTNHNAPLYQNKNDHPHLPQFLTFFTHWNITNMKTCLKKKLL